MSVNAAPSVAAVVIGRNEGARLVACLAALVREVERVVYVDSGSTDGSVAAAEALGVEAVALGPERPFSAARARNAGFARLATDPRGAPDLVQFVDGDCTIAPGWIEAARGFLGAHPGVAAVCGRRRERHPEASIYNRLCDWEWNTAIGRARACGGDAMIRTDAIREVGGYREDVIAAEDDEFCIRLRRAGWSVWRLDAEMTAHDAAMTRFSQWWRRSVRSGHAFAQVGDLHPGYFGAERRRQLVWGLMLPALALAALLFAPRLAWLVVLLFGLSFVRAALRFRGSGMDARDALACGGLLTLSKFPGTQGALTWRLRRLRRAAQTIIEYK